jgi:Alpha-galactosyl-binding fungal lectin
MKTLTLLLASGALLAVELLFVAALPDRSGIQRADYMMDSPSSIKARAILEGNPQLSKRVECPTIDCMLEGDAKCADEGCLGCGATYYCYDHDAAASGVKPPAPEKQCNGLGSNKYLTRNNIAQIIQEQFCKDQSVLSTLNSPSGSIWKTYDRGTNEEVNIGIEWQPGQQTKPDSSLCTRFLLGLVIDGCDTDNQNDPMNWKSGGSVQVDKMTYHVQPAVVRQPAPKSPGAGCSSTYDGLYDQHWIWGNGWGGYDWGSALEEQLKGCARLPSTFHVSYGLGGDGREWTAMVRTGIWQKGCVGHAIKSAGGPETKCTGTG